MGLLDGKVGLVTGAGRGLGRTTALSFAAEGARVIVADRDAESGEETAELVREAGGEALFVETDVREPEQVEAMVARTVSEYDRLDCASNNAAAGAFYALTPDLPVDKWELAISVTLTGVWLCMKYEIPAMLESGGGSIVNVSSASSVKGEALLAAYAAAKGGVNTLTMTAAAEYAERGIRINAVLPGGIRTPAIEHYFEAMPEIRERTIRAHAMNRLGEPEEIAEAIVWLASDRASFVTGHLLHADGGVLIRSHLPA
jgi:NAD(P)-dependent dehydrogenase (short-subunit alcohol dehydrogenase family)